MEEDTFIIGKPKLKSCISHFSVDAESGYEDGVGSDVNDVTETLPEHGSLEITRDKGVTAADSLVENISDLTLDSDTRPPSAVSFASTTSSVARRRRSRIPVRSKPLNTQNTNIVKLKLQIAPGRAKSCEDVQKKEELKIKKRKSSKNQAAPLDIWEIQRTLKRGEFVEGVLTVGGGRSGLIRAPVAMDRGRLDWR